MAGVLQNVFGGGAPSVAAKSDDGKLQLGRCTLSPEKLLQQSVTAIDRGCRYALASVNFGLNNSHYRFRRFCGRPQSFSRKLDSRTIGTTSSRNHRGQQHPLHFMVPGLGASQSTRFLARSFRSAFLALHSRIPSVGHTQE